LKSSESHSKTDSSWFAVVVRPNNLSISNDEFDGLCADLCEHGAAGTAVDRAPEIACYLEGSQESVDSFLTQVSALGCSVISVSAVRHENWTAACPDVWEPIRAGVIEVVPVQSAEDDRPAAPGAIRIIPGLGFGTGHHSTTRMVLSALCDHVKTIAEPRALRVYDLGTGSGILAIAAAKLLGVAVEGNDIDLGALENARDNIALNNVQHLVSVSNAPITAANGPYDLILANVYGEVLMNLASELTRIACPGATAILSGITEIVWDQVWHVYGSEYRWELISEQSENGWMCAVIRAPNG
jgi:ribosomal protein L11 methyltransferase